MIARNHILSAGDGGDYSPPSTCYILGVVTGIASFGLQSRANKRAEDDRKQAARLQKRQVKATEDIQGDLQMRLADVSRERDELFERLEVVEKTTSPRLATSAFQPLPSGLSFVPIALALASLFVVKGVFK